MSITFFCNPARGASRNVPAPIRRRGMSRGGWSICRPAGPGGVGGTAGAGPRAVLREKGAPAAELGLLDLGVSDGAILDAIIAHPILVERPIVRTPLGVKLCRPSETVLDMLDHPPERFTEEDGEVVATGSDR